MIFITKISLHPSEFNVARSLVQGLVRAYPGTDYREKHFTGGREKFCPDALLATTNDSYGYQRKLNPGSLDAFLSP